MSADGDLEAFLVHRDEASFRRLYRGVTPMLYALSLRLTAGSRPDAEDIVQEAWTRAIERIDRFERRSSFRTWLCGFVVNCYREHVRRMAKGPRPLDDTDLPHASINLVDHSRRPDPIDVERAIARLPDGFREAVVLHDLNGYTHREIAQLLGIEEGTSKSQLARGRARLRELLRAEVAPGQERGRR